MDVAAWLEDHDIDIVRLEAPGIDGQLLGKHLARKKFEKSLDAGVSLSDFALMIDIGGTPQLGWWADWRQPAFGDILLVADPSTLVAVPWEPGIATCLGAFTEVDGTPLPVCPRTLLRRQQDDLAARGYEARCSFELEFFLFEERIDVARRRGFKQLTPVGGSYTKPAYMTQRSPELVAFFRDVTQRLEGLGIEWEAITDEAAPGQLELNLAPLAPVAAADAAIRAKQVLRETAYDHDRVVTFMARPFAELGYGSGLHLHLSLWRDRQRAFGPDAPALRHWLGGTMATIAGAVSVMTPTVNSFRRQVDFVAVPTTPTWGEENKAAAVRTVTRTGSLARVEHRVGAADANPYLVLATAMAGGIAGLDEELEPPEAVKELPWGLPDDRPRLPHSLTTAAEALAADTRLRRHLGDAFVDHWCESRKWEWLMFHTSGGDPDATGSTDWELTRYFEWV